MYLLSHKYITMKGLSVVKFWDVRPKLPFRFNTTFFTGINAKCDSRLPFCVNNITLPKMEGSASEGSMYLGNTIFTVPVWNIASRKLEITFEETDKMLVSQFIDVLNQNSYGQTPYNITVVITEFEEHMRNGNARAFICHLTSYEEPAFKRDGGVAQVTLTASFIVDSVVDNWNGQIVTGKNALKNNGGKYNQELDTLYTNYQNNEFTFGNVDFDVPADVANGGHRYNYNSNTKDFTVSQEEIDNAYDKISKQDKFGKNVKKEDLEIVQKENAKRMEKSMNKFKQLLKEKGYEVGVNAYNDANHETGIGSNSGSHLLGQKIDLTFKTRKTTPPKPNRTKRITNYHNDFPSR